MKKELRDYLHLYLGCECRIGDSSKEYFIRMVNETGLSVCIGTNSKGIPIWYKSKSCRPILRPLSDMTEEEKGELLAIIGEPQMYRDGFFFLSDNGFLNIRNNNSTVSFGFNIEAINYLRLQCVDVDGLIEAGLAIDKTKELYPD